MNEQINLVVVEGALEIPAARKVLRALSLLSEDIQIIDKHGKERFWADAFKYNRAAAAIGPILGITDLNHFPCPSGLIQKHLKQGVHPKFILRIAERELESWLLADTDALAKFLSISPDIFPPNPDEESDPKQTLVNLARRSRKTSLRDDLVPEQGSRHPIGKGYQSRMVEFIEEKWRPLKAQDKSESLRRAIKAIKEATATL
ncbi:MAG: hypothetical protein ACREEM_02595 [Blastocatellia bacterium]